MKLHTILFVALFVTVLSISAQEKYGLRVGQEAPEFDYYDLSNQRFNFADLKGQVVLVNFFATWCGPCRHELPLLETVIWEKYKKTEGFKMLVFGRGHNPEEINKFKAQNLYDLPMYPDNGEIIYNLFASRYIPRTFIVDKKGLIAYISIGFNKSDFDEMIKAVDTLLKE